MNHSKQKRTGSLPKLPLPPETRDLTATQGMLQLVRTELKEDISGLRSEMKAGFSKIDARFKRVDARFNTIDARFNTIDARFDKIDARFNEIDGRFGEVDGKFHEVVAAIHGLTAQVARQGMLVEEQNARNNIVLEALTGLTQRQNRVESRMDETEKLVHAFVRPVRKPAT